MSALRWITSLGMLLLISLLFVPIPVQAQGPPPADFTLYASQVDPNGLVRISWTGKQGVDFSMFYVYRSFVPFADSMSFVRVDSTRNMSFEDHLPNTNISLGEKYAYFVIGRTTLGAFLKTNTVTAEVPGIPPQNAFRLDAKVDSGKVKLQWDKPLVSLSTPYSVYRINLLSMTSPVTPIVGGDTTFLATTSDLFYTDTPPSSSTLRFFAYFVTAKTTGNVLIQSCLALVEIRDGGTHDVVKFVSIPVKTAQVGVQYVYDADAVSSDPSAVIRYNVESPLSSVFIKCDTATGAITLTPVAKQIIPIHVIARSSKGGSAVQEFQITVSGANGIISGKVTDTLGHAIKGVFINLLKRDARASFCYDAVTDSLGNYRVTKLDLGTYYVHAIPVKGDYLDQWFDGKSSALEANPVIVADSPSVAVADFKLRSKSGQPDVSYIVQGKVLDTLGLPISVAGAQVYFVNADFAFNAPNIRPTMELNRDLDFRFQGNSRFVFKATPDSTGAYSVKIPAGPYIAFAKAPGYSIQFYKDKAYFLLADIIKLAADSAGVSFTLSTLPPIALGQISGQVLDTVKNVGVRARLIAFRTVIGVALFRPNVHASFTETDSLGAYEFKDLLPGYYFVLALPVGNYAPVFFSDGSQSLRWDKATPITVNGNSVSGINLYPPALPDSGRGYTAIKGSVIVSSSNGAFGGAMIYASYQTGRIAGYTVTDAKGNFVIDGLAPGTYTVFADAPGYSLLNSAQTSPSYDPSGNAVTGTVSLSLKATSVHTVTTTTIPTQYALEQNYPNPFNPSTTIRYTLPLSGKVSVRIYNLLGQLVTALVDQNQNAGTYEVSFNASSLSSGVYLYRIESGNFSAVKKMMLLK